MESSESAGQPETSRGMARARRPTENTAWQTRTAQPRTRPRARGATLPDSASGTSTDSTRSLSQVRLGLGVLHVIVRSIRKRPESYLLVTDLKLGVLARAAQSRARATAETRKSQRTQAQCKSTFPIQNVKLI